MLVDWNWKKGFETKSCLIDKSWEMGAEDAVPNRTGQQGQQEQQGG